MKDVKLAIPTKGSEGIEDVVSDVFGRAERFTIIEIRNGSIANVEVVDNSAALYKHGAGPIVVKMLADMSVTAVAAREFGIGASTLLDQNNIKKFKVNTGIPVREAVETVLKKQKFAYDPNRELRPLFLRVLQQEFEYIDFMNEKSSF